MHLDTARDQYIHQSRSHSCKGTPSRIELLVASLPSRETSSPTGARATHGAGIVAAIPNIIKSNMLKRGQEIILQLAW